MVVFVKEHASARGFLRLKGEFQRSIGMQQIMSLWLPVPQERSY